MTGGEIHLAARIGSLNLKKANKKYESAEYYKTESKACMYEWIVIQSEDKNTGWGINCSCNSFTIEAILRTVQTFDKGVDAKCSASVSLIFAYRWFTYTWSCRVWARACKCHHPHVNYKCQCFEGSALRWYHRVHNNSGPLSCSSQRYVHFKSPPVTDGIGFSWVASSVLWWALQHSGARTGISGIKPLQWYIIILYRLVCQWGGDRFSAMIIFSFRFDLLN